MPDETGAEDYELEVVDDVQWLTDDDGTEYFVDDGVRYELGDDGYAYAVGEATEPAVDEEEPPAAWERAAGTPAPEPAEGAAGTSGPRPLSATGSISQPRPTGGGGFRWPTAATPGSHVSPSSAPSTSDAERPSRVTASGPEAPSPFSREAEAARVESGGGDSDVTREIATATAPATTGNGGGELLRLESVRSGYGTLPVLHGVDMSVAAGETAVLLGLNGAGKTTTAMNICGALKTWDGTITFDGTDITSWSTKKAVDAGVVMVPEGRRVFPDLTVAKNLQMGGWSQRKDRDWLEEQRERVFGYFPRLRERASQMAGTLSGGEQQMLSIARGLMARPKLLIIDEASMGLAPVIVADVFRIVGQINQDGTTVLMIEQNVAALDVADVAYVMEQGRMVRELRGEKLRDRDQVSDVLMG